MASFIKNLSFSLKITIFSSFLLIIFFVLDYTRTKNNIEVYLKNQVNTAYSLLENYHKQFENGEITEAKAKKQSIDAIMSLRYGDDGKDYFWVHNRNLVMEGHPYSTHLNGKDVSKVKDKKEKFLFQEMNKVVEKEGEGFIEYFWALKNQQNKIAQKISFVKAFTPWGWIIGTGKYKEEINYWQKALLIILLFPLIFLIAVYIEKVSKRSITTFSNNLKSLKDSSDWNVRINDQDLPKDIQNVAIEINSILENLTSFFNDIYETVKELDSGNIAVNMQGNYVGNQKVVKELFSKMTSNLSLILEDVKNTAERVNEGARQVANASKGLSGGAMNQASSIEEVSSTVHEIKDKTSNTTKNVSEASGLSASAKEMALEGNRRMKDMLEGMNEINSSSEDITKIIKVIDEIAFQTNLLSLNAAVEAARAGKHGKGFAVVAQEVRNLAQKSAKAAKETTEMILASNEKVVSGTKIAEDVGKYLDNIAESVTNVTNNLEEITKAAKDQEEAVFQIGEALQNIGVVTQKTAADIESASSGAQKLFAEAQSLISSLGSFRLSENDSGDILASGPKSKDFIVWSDRFSVKVPSIDSQHKALVDMINKLYHLMSDGGTREELSTIFNGLVNYTAKHFQYEEKLFDKYQYENTTEHKELHKKLVNSVLEFKSKFDNGDETLSFDLLDFLKNWLINHILGEDIKYSEFFSSKEIK